MIRISAKIQMISKPASALFISQTSLTLTYISSNRRVGGSPYSLHGGGQNCAAADLDGAHRPGEEEQVCHKSNIGNVVYAGTLSSPLPVDISSKVDG